MNEITLDQLAIMVQKGFEETVKTADFFALIERIDRLEERMDRLERRVEYGFETVAKELKEIRIQLNELDARASNDISRLCLRVDKIERRLKTR